MKEPLFVYYYLSKWMFLPPIGLMIVMALITYSTYTKYRIKRPDYVIYRFFFIDWTFVLWIHYVCAIIGAYYYKKNLFDYTELYKNATAALVYILLSLGSILAIYLMNMYVYSKMYLDAEPNNRMAFLIAITSFSWIYLIPMTI